MYILAMRTDQPEAKVSLYDGPTQIAQVTWAAHRQLGASLHLQVHDMLTANSLDWTDVGAIIVYQGPGSFTGLRIGISVANALGYSLECPVIGVTDEQWQSQRFNELVAAVTPDVPQVLPNYGAEAHITSPKR